MDLMFIVVVFRAIYACFCLLSRCDCDLTQGINLGTKSTVEMLQIKYIRNIQSQITILIGEINPKHHVK